MQKFPCSLFVLKQSYICYYIICMTVPLRFSLKTFMQKKIKRLIPVWDDTHMTFIKILYPCPSTSEIILPLDLWRLPPPPLLQMITNQLKENMIRGWLFDYYMLSTMFIIIKGWLHCLTSESKGIFLISNIV